MSSCGSDESTSPTSGSGADTQTPNDAEPVDTGPPVDTPAPNDTSPPLDVPTDVGDQIAVPDVGVDVAAPVTPWEDPDSCHPDGSFGPLQLACESAESVLGFSESAVASHFDAAVSNDVVGTAWSVGSTIYTSVLDDVGSEPVQQSFEASGDISGLELLSADPGFLLVYSVGVVNVSGDNPMENAQAVTSEVQLSALGILGEPTTLSENFELRPGGEFTADGYRLWGVAAFFSDSEALRMATLLSLENNGDFRSQHTIKPAASFAFFRLHTHGTQLNAPFVSSGDEPSVSYYIQSVFIAGCGLPTLPIQSLTADQQMVATTFVELNSVWLISEPSTCENGATTINVHDTGTKVTVPLALSFGASSLAEAAVSNDSSRIMLADVQDDSLMIAAIDPFDGLVSVPRTVGSVIGETVTDLRLLSTTNGWVAVRRSDNRGTALTATRLCTEN
ncbi:MAG: hypothetical protein ACI9OJ_004846 [Myxococcota bacterium]|jgi:hypothetical protein